MDLKILLNQYFLCSSALLEIRNIDLNPFDINGFSYEQAEFLHIFLIYLLWKDEGDNYEKWVKIGDYYNDIVSLENPLEHTYFEIDAKKIIDEMEYLVEILNLNISDSLLVNFREMLTNPSKTLSGE